jgi:hypothetical protein
MAILQLRAGEKDLIIANCVLIEKSIGILKYDMLSLDKIYSVITKLIECFTLNSQNICCLQTFAYICMKSGNNGDRKSCIMF